MRDTVNLIRFKEKISYWINEGEDRFSILYFGKRNWGYNTAGILYMDKSGNELIDTTPSKVIEGYTVSVYVAEKEDKYTPIRVNLINDIENQYGDNLYSNDNNYNTSEDFSKKEEEIKEERSTGYLEDPKNEFYLFDKIGYRLSVIEAALGSRFYVLDKTTNGGVSWEVINKDPFIGEIGVAEGIKFIDSNIGFIILSHSGGSYADIYRTGDGGKNFQKLIIPEISVTLSNNVSYNPFEFPNIPYEEDGCLFMEVGQGSDGDYNGGVKAIYKSIDKGENWSIVSQG